MTNTEDDFDFGALVTWFIENGVFVIGAFVLFAKTSDLMTKFAPSEFMGYTDIASIYGFVVACMVEGAFVGMKLALGRPRNVLAWVSNVILIIAPFGVSALAQVFDSFITQDTLAQQTPEIQFFATWFIPSIPTLIVALFLGKAILESMPPQLMRGFKKTSTVEVSKPATNKPVRTITKRESIFKNWVNKMRPAPKMVTNNSDVELQELREQVASLKASQTQQDAQGATKHNKGGNNATPDPKA